jgi:hypothetical protein
MRFAKFCAFLILFISLVSLASPFWRKHNSMGSRHQESPVEAFKSEELVSPVRIYFDQKIIRLKMELRKTLSVKDRRKLVHETFVQIEQNRKAHEMAEVDDEVYMDVISHSLDELPEARDFDSGQCATYRRAVLRDYEPTALDEDGPEDPAVVEAMEILQIICE